MAEYICREAIIDDLEEEIEAGNVALDEDVWVNKGLRIAIRDIKDIKTADVKPVKRGYWKDVMMSEATGWDLTLTGGRDEVLETVCSECGNCCAFGWDGEAYLSPYCPNCGARLIKYGDTE